MATYLLTWNPARWPWTDLQTCITYVQTHGTYRDRWGSGRTKHISPDDRFFLMKLGQRPCGLMASGYVTSKVYTAEHWDEAARLQGKLTRYVDIRFDTLLDPDKDLFPRAWLNADPYTQMLWEPRASGSLIPEIIAAQLEIDWARFLNRPSF